MDDSFTSPDLGAERALVALKAAGFAIGPSRSVTRTLLDTFDGRLHAAGLRLELRQVGQTGALELVLGGGGPAGAHTLVEEAPRRAADLPPGPLRSRLAPLLDVRALTPVATVKARTRGAVRRDRTGKARVTVVVSDRVSAQSAAKEAAVSRRADLWAADVESLAGYPKDAAAARELLTSIGLRGQPGDLIDAATATFGVDIAGVKCSPTVALEPDLGALDAFRRVLTNLAGAVEVNRPGTIDDVDPEFLHDLRVAVRRTRSVLGEGKGVLPRDIRTKYREGFGWLGRASGPARDLDVYRIEWDDYVAPLAADARTALRPVFDHIGGQRLAEYAGLTKALRSAQYRTLLSGWTDWLAAANVDCSGKDALRPITEVAANRIGRAQQQLLSRGRTIGPDTAPEELHELRKDAKALRYLLECLGGLYSASPRRVFVQRLKALQDNLGEHQDTEVHVAQLRDMSNELHGTVSPDTLIAMGQLTENLEGRRRAARAEFSARFAAYDTKQTAVTLDALLQSQSGKHQ